MISVNPYVINKQNNPPFIMPKIKTSKGDIYFHRKFLYIGIKQIDRDIAFENLNIISQVLNKENINWGPYLGTLLGIVRDNNFIAWDEDTDLFILHEDEEKLKNALWVLIDLGFEVIRYERRGLYSIMRKGEYVDFYILKEVSPTLRFSGGGSDYIFSKFLEETILWNFRGMPIKIFKQYEEYLTFQYGDWKTPVQYADFNLNIFKRTFYRLKSFIKNNLPDNLYYYLLRKHHLKHFQNFKEKCKKNGIIIPEHIKLPEFR